MSPRTRPVACVGQVNILGPTQSNPYYRLTWLRLDGKQGRTTSTSLDNAKQKAAGIDADLNHEGARLGSATLEQIVTHYVSSPVGRNQKTQGADWKPLQLEMITDKLASALRGHETVVARDLNRTILDQMRRAAGTRNTRKEISTALRGMLRWGYSNDYFTPEQAELLPTNLVDLEGTVMGTQAPKRPRGLRADGQGTVYVRDEDAPSLALILTLRGTFDAAFPLWGALAVELAHATGLRWGEQFQLTAHDVLDQRGDEDPSVLVRVDWQINSAAKRRDPEPVFRIRPKGNKGRRPVVPTLSITGYEVRECLLARAQAALAEQRDGTNPEALLFPTTGGQLWSSPSFGKRGFKPAALAAEGWKCQPWVQTKDVWRKDLKQHECVSVPRLQFDLTWHSFRHRFARTAIDVYKLEAGELMMVGGWESKTVVENTYYKAGHEHQIGAQRKMA